MRTLEEKIAKIKELLGECESVNEVIHYYNDWRERQNNINKHHTDNDGRIGDIEDACDAQDFIYQGDIKSLVTQYVLISDLHKKYHFVVMYDSLDEWELMSDDETMEYIYDDLVNVYDGFLEWLKEL